MNKLREKKAFTLIEVLIAIVIFATIALPLLSVFVQSIKTDRAANNVLNANYISQDYIEKLSATTYAEALADRPSGSEIGDYYLSATIKPYGTLNALFPEQCSYAHLVMYSDGKMLAVLPDGKWNMFDSVASNISLSTYAGMYTFICGYTTITGPSEYSYCAALIDAMQKPLDTTTAVALGTGCKAVLYCKKNHADDVTITGDNIKYEDIISGDTSLIHVTASVYDSSPSTAAIGSSESYINIKNWLL